MKILKNKILWLFFLAVIAHGFLLLMDGVYWDDFLLVDKISAVDFGKTFAFFNGGGNVFNAYAFLHWGLKYVFAGHFIFGCRVATFVFLFINAVLVYFLFNRVGKYAELDAFFIAALSLTYFAQQSASLIILWPYHFFITLFLTGAYIVLIGTERRERLPWRKWTSLGLFWLSFIYGSNLAVYFVFLFTLFMVKNQVGLKYYQRIKQFILEQYLFILLPFFFLFIKYIFFPTFGFYKSINYSELIIFRENGLGFALYFFAKNFSIAMFQVVVVFCICLVFYLLNLWFMGRRINKDKRLTNELNGFSFGMFFLVLAIIPNAFVAGFILENVIYSYRQLLLAGIPIALITLVTLKMFSRFIYRPKKFVVIVLSLVVFIQSATLIKTYMRIQLLWIKDQAFVQKLSEMPEAKKYSFFFIKTPAQIHDHVWFEWGYLFKEAWGGSKWIGQGNDKIWKKFTIPKDYYNEFFDLPDYDPNGPKAEMIIDYPNCDGIKQLGLLCKYYAYKYGLIKSPTKETFLNNMVTVKVIPVKENEKED